MFYVKGFLIGCLVVFSVLCSVKNVNAECNNPACSGNGICKNDVCDCYTGWWGSECQFCGGKIRLTDKIGTIYDGPGNYSLSNKCSWLVDAPNSTITLHIEDFATECGWDYLYVYDGDSADSPLIAAFSGFMYKNPYGVKKIPEITAKSGLALIYFFSDDVLSANGFNITYRLNSCPSAVSGVDCSGNGKCVGGKCNCDSSWRGAACHLELCPNNCFDSQNRGICVPKIGCNCLGFYKGNSCNKIDNEGYWETVTAQGLTPIGSASHSAVVWKNFLYIFGGKRFNGFGGISIYDFNDKTWADLLTPKELKYGHSTVLYGDKIYLYGGLDANDNPTAELWTFDLVAKIWEQIVIDTNSCKDDNTLCGPLTSMGHTATVVVNRTNNDLDKMVVIFGYSQQYSYLNTVQEYYFNTGKWIVVDTGGYPVKGGYGHTASWDALTEKIYVYGGIVPESNSMNQISKHIYSYEPNTRIWTLLRDAPSARALHTSDFLTDGLMLVFAGKLHSDLPQAKCYSNEFLTYDVLCDAWHVMDVAEYIDADLARYGHSSVIVNGSLYIYGGFNGEMLTDILKYTSGHCKYTTKPSCVNSKAGVKCVWDSKFNFCNPVRRVAKNLVLNQEDNRIIRCSEITRGNTSSNIRKKEKTCERMNSSIRCLHTSSECMWCQHSCVHSLNKCTVDNSTGIEENTSLLDTISICNQFISCKTCIAQKLCGWNTEKGKCVPHSHYNNSEAFISTNQNQCETSCSEYNSCTNCTSFDCVWCSNENKCVENNAYFINFPYGQCRDWTVNLSKCKLQEDCKSHTTCEKCQNDPACGWCDDGSNTGVGACMHGGYKGPTSQSLQKCPSERWYFTDCPKCQCNGHSSCKNNTNICNKCSSFTEGQHCENCIKGYWGEARNGGKCKQCDCFYKDDNNCDNKFGKCLCTTKGNIGDHCELCDARNNYFMDSYKNMCYYTLQTNYEYTFNLSKKLERQYTKINFKHSPMMSDLDVDIQITFSAPAKMNISVKTEYCTETLILKNYRCTSFKSNFPANSRFGTTGDLASTTFYVHVYDFEAPLWVRISFTQISLYNKLWSSFYP